LIAPKKIPTPRTRKLKSKLNEANVKGAPVTVPTAKVMPKPRTRQSRKKINQPHFNQPNTSL
jgi:hypothetical protein